MYPLSCSCSDVGQRLLYSLCLIYRSLHNASASWTWFSIVCASACSPACRSTASLGPLLHCLFLIEHVLWADCHVDHVGGFFVEPAVCSFISFLILLLLLASITRAQRHRGNDLPSTLSPSPSNLPKKISLIAAGLFGFCGPFSASFPLHSSLHSLRINSFS